MQGLLKKYALYGAIPSFLIAGVLLLFPGQLLGVYLGDKFMAAGSTSQILAVAPLFAAWSGLGGYALAVTGFQRYCIAVNIIVGLFVLVAGYPAAHYAQAHGLAWVCVAGFTLKHAAEWLRRIAINRAIDVHRADRRTRRLEDAVEAEAKIHGSSAAPDQNLDRDDTRAPHGV